MPSCLVRKYGHCLSGKIPNIPSPNLPKLSKNRRVTRTVCQEGRREFQEEMSTQNQSRFITLATIATMAMAGCSHVPGGGDPTDSPVPRSDSKSGPVQPPKRVSNRPANPSGVTFIAEYHHIRAGAGEMFRSPAAFRKDLETFYQLGFRPVLASEFLANKMPLPPGASPVVMTFDDSQPTQLKLLKDGSVDPNCGVGIWMDFAKTHPDFPVHGTFFVLPENLFTTNKRDPRKVKLLLSLGSELANHTIHHPKLKKLSDEKVKWELGTANDKLVEMGQTMPVSMALPFGMMPKNKKLLEGFDWQGKKVQFTGVFLSGAAPAKPPTDPKYNALRVPRILAATVPYGLDYWIKLLKAGKVKPYVAP